MKLLDILFESVLDMNERKLMTKDEFVRQSREVHGDKYSYDNVDYKGSQIKVNITCPIHGDFPQTPSVHLQDNGCSKCGYIKAGSNRTKNNNQFIKDAQRVHKDKNGDPLYIYNKVDYKGLNKEVTITCPKHGDFKQKPTLHLAGKGCKKCGFEKTRMALGHSQEKYIQKAEKRWGKGTYDYSNLKYNGSENPVDIICHQKDENEEEHGPFTIGRAQWFIAKKNPMYCPKCTKLNHKKYGLKRALTQDEFLERARQEHRKKDGSPKYTYENIEDGTTPYINGNSRILVTCPKHGPFPIGKAESHIHSKSGCPKCSTSKGEDMMIQYLYSLGYNTIKDKKFKDCNNLWKNKLTCNEYKFDAYSSELNTIFEFDGSMHFVPGAYKQTQEQFELRALDDKYKNDYCLKNGIKLVRIGYLDKNDIKNQIDKSLKVDDMLWLSDNYPKAGWNK